MHVKCFLENTACLSTFVKMSIYSSEKKYAVYISVFFKSLHFIKFGKIKKCFTHHFKGDAFIFCLAYGINFSALVDGVMNGFSLHIEHPS